MRAQSSLFSDGLFVSWNVKYSIFYGISTAEVFQFNFAQPRPMSLWSTQQQRHRRRSVSRSDSMKEFQFGEDRFVIVKKVKGE